ncbi:MAG: hypothetical protein U5N56_01760 [Candidatus Marinimicrobia bacterium]|nr:hypothetical protein [Candidatus Neomarinimicrobiota bacterium]
MGEAICTLLARNGATVIMNYRRSQTKAEALCEKLSGKACNAVYIRPTFLLSKHHRPWWMLWSTNTGRLIF